MWWQWVVFAGALAGGITIVIALLRRADKRSAEDRKRNKEEEVGQL